MRNAQIFIKSLVASPPPQKRVSFQDSTDFVLFFLIWASFWGRGETKFYGRIYSGDMGFADKSCFQGVLALRFVF